MRHGYPPLGLRANSSVSSNVFVLVLFWGSPEHPLVHRRHPLLSVELGTKH